MPKAKAKKSLASHEMPFVWHGHHECVSPLEVLVEPVERRVSTIMERKPPKERSARLRLLKLVDESKLPKELVKARNKVFHTRIEYRKTFIEPQALFDKIRAEFYEAVAELEGAIQTYQPAILALHAQECQDCPWDGTTIFPRKRGNPQ